MALLCILVCALQDWILLDGGHCLLLVHTAQPSVRVLLTAAEGDPALDLHGAVPLCRLPVIWSVRHSNSTSYSPKTLNHSMFFSINLGVKVDN